MISSYAVPAILASWAVSSAGASSTKGRSDSIHWGPCNEAEFETSDSMECGTLAVPLDYTKPESSQTVDLQLLRIPATEQPSKGAIQLNFGGPGLRGTAMLAQQGYLFQAMSGGEYDLVAFDPRGTGNTLPFSCQDPDEKRSVVERTLAARHMINSTTLQELWDQSRDVVAECEKKSINGDLITTAFVARDLMQVAQVLDEDGMLRYWGMSYGSTLGATVAAMFPKRIDKMVLDGILNSHEYYFDLADYQGWTDTDMVFSGMFKGCVERPQNCDFAQSFPDATSDELEQKVWDLLDHLQEEPMTVGDVVVDYSFVKGTIAGSLYATSAWPRQASIFDMLVTRERDEELVKIVKEQAEEAAASAGEEYVTLGIRCSDRGLREEKLEALVPVAERLANISKIYGDLVIDFSMMCAQWEIEPAERFEGTFDIDTEAPVLLIANTYDGFTPFVSAQNLSSTIDGSVILQVDGYGHTSTSLPSKCTVEKVAAYWVNGTMPAEGTICDVDAAPYSGVTWRDVIEEMTEEQLAGQEKEGAIATSSAEQYQMM